MDRQQIPAEACVAYGGGRAAWERTPATLPGEGEVLVRTVASAVNVGHERALIGGHARLSRPVTYPVVTGYECVGIIERVGKGVRVAPGTRVVGLAGHRTRFTDRVDQLVPIPDGIDDRLALLTILTRDVWKGISRIEPIAGEHIVVTGAGAVGLIATWMLRQKEPSLAGVTVIEPDTARQALALKLGAAIAIGPDDSLALEADAGVECSSNAAAFTRLQESMRRRGRICVLADGMSDPFVLAPAFHRNELTIVAATDGDDYANHARWLFARAPRAIAALLEIFDHEVRSEYLPGFFTRLVTGEIRPLKALVRYPEPEQPL
jgi:alcohol dehydrogenase